MFVRKAAFCRIPATMAPASAEFRNESSGTGFCCEPKVPVYCPVGSTLLVRHRIPTGPSDLNLRAPEEPTGRLRSVLRTSTTSRIFPAGRTNDAVVGDGFELPLARNETWTVASV